MAKFPMGQVVMTIGIADVVAQSHDWAKFVADGLKRHAAGDWGDLSEEDKQENDLSLKEGFRLLSAYKDEVLPEIWIITEADRSVTTVLFPDEY